MICKLMGSASEYDFEQAHFYMVERGLRNGCVII